MVSGSLEWCMMVPAVTEVCLPQWAHSQVHGLVCRCQALRVPQPGHTKPVGQRAANRYSAHAASSQKRCWNSIKEWGKSVIGVIRRRYVRDLFYHKLAPPATTFCGPGCRGISLRNSTEIRPTVITGDMHSVNKANFAILDWFGMQAAPRFTSLQAQIPHLFCA